MVERLLEIKRKVAGLERATPESHIRVCSYCGQKNDDAREEWAQVPGTQGDSNVAHARWYRPGVGPEPLTHERPGPTTRKSSSVGAPRTRTRHRLPSIDARRPG